MRRFQIVSTEGFTPLLSARFVPEDVASAILESATYMFSTPDIRLHTDPLELHGGGPVSKDGTSSCTRIPERVSPFRTHPRLR